jgi:pantoate--beta-alanine ligase
MSIKMKIITSISDWRNQTQQISSLGFVPTMGCLHQGHASLVKQSLAENNSTVVSIFINPTQFNKAEDLEKYPNQIDEDLCLLESMGVDYCFIPDYTTLYPDDYQYKVCENKLSSIMEGTHRPGHFDGMLTVVMKLLNILKPTNAYFGEKDYQQYLLVKKMVEAFFIDTKIIACPTIRNNNGLAHSSRNLRLTRIETAEYFAETFRTGKSCEEITRALQAQNIDVEYIQEHDNRRYAAVKIDGVRLIDNYRIDNPCYEGG